MKKEGKSLHARRNIRNEVQERGTLTSCSFPDFYRSPGICLYTCAHTCMHTCAAPDAIIAAEFARKRCTNSLCLACCVM